MRIVVNTPAGNIGRPVVDQLLEAGHEVVIISRHPDKVAAATAKGAQLVRGSIDDPSTLDRALKGADVLFWLTPIVFDQPDYAAWAKQIAVLATESATRNDVERAVLISTVGAQPGSRSALLECMWTVEETFKAALPNVTVLRPGAFMENFLNNVHTIATAGMIFGRYPTTKKIPMVATRDVAEKATASLLEESDGSKLLELHGPEDLDQPTAARILSEVLGRPVKYVEVSAEQWRQGALGAGMPSFFIKLMLDMYGELQADRMERVQPRSASTTNTTTFKEFARAALKPAIEAEAAIVGSGATTASA
jgi:uncharacterized protein YbjT (DUF2867 family)